MSGLLTGLAFDFSDEARVLDETDTLGEPDIPDDPEVMLDVTADQIVITS
ncbi:MAG: hypothetical protein L3J30_06730 [Marinosulfonomonas sp.]|nr:hypothetical protein [Marinosulfonomonas sp.]